MGGTIGVIIREEDGKVHKMARWTNNLPYFTRNMKFINKDKEYLAQYLKTFYEMVDEYNEKKAAGKEDEMGMCQCYVPQSGFIAPIEYGIIVIDYQTNKLVHCQGYSSLDSLYIFEVDNIQREREDDRVVIKELIDNKKIKSLRVFYDREGGLSEVPIEYKTINGQTKIVLSEELKEEEIIHKNGYALDLSPWEIFRFEETEEGFIKTKEKIKEIGFEITEEDEKLWQEFIDYRYHNEEEE